MELRWHKLEDRSEMLQNDAVPWLETEDGIYILQVRLNQLDGWQNVPVDQP